MHEQWTRTATVVPVKIYIRVFLQGNHNYYYSEAKEDSYGILKVLLPSETFEERGQRHSYEIPV